VDELEEQAGEDHCWKWDDLFEYDTSGDMSIITNRVDDQLDVSYEETDEQMMRSQDDKEDKENNNESMCKKVGHVDNLSTFIQRKLLSDEQDGIEAENSPSTSKVGHSLLMRFQSVVSPNAGDSCSFARRRHQVQRE